MFWDFFLFVIIGPLIAFFIYYLTEDRKRADRYRAERDRCHLIF